MNLRRRSLAELYLNLWQFRGLYLGLRLLGLIALLILCDVVGTEGILFGSLRQVGARVFSEVILSVEGFSALGADLGLLARVNDEVEI